MSDENTNVNKNKDVILRMSNKMAQAKFDAKNVIEARVIAVLASKIKRKDPDFKEYSISVKEIVHDDSKNIGYLYSRIKETADNLSQKSMKIEKYNEKGKKYFGNYPLFSKLEYVEGDAYLLCEFNYLMKPHLLLLANNFAKIPLQVFLQIRSVYTQKLFNYLWSLKHHKIATVELEDMIERFLCTGEYRKWYNFKRYILTPGLREINNLAETNITYTPIKTGRKVTHIRFDLSSVPNYYFGIEKEKKNNDQDAYDPVSPIMEKLIAADINKKQAQEIEDKLTEIEEGENWLDLQIPILKKRYEKLQNKKTSLGGYIYKSLLSEINKVKVQKEQSKKKAERIAKIKEDIANDKINIGKNNPRSMNNTLTSYVGKGLMTEKERDVIKTYFTNEEFLEIYQDMQDKYDALGDEEQFPLKVKHIYDLAYEKIYGGKEDK